MLIFVERGMYTFKSTSMALCPPMGTPAKKYIYNADGYKIFNKHPFTNTLPKFNFRRCFSFCVLVHKLILSYILGKYRGFPVCLEAVCVYDIYISVEAL